jgi:hypothetical protein
MDGWQRRKTSLSSSSPTTCLQAYSFILSKKMAKEVHTH